MTTISACRVTSLSALTTLMDSQMNSPRRAMTAANGYSPCDFADCAKAMQRRIIVKSGTAVSREVAVFESSLPFPPAIGVGYSDNRDPLPQIDFETTEKRNAPCPLKGKMVEAIFIGYATSARWRDMARWSSRSLASAGVPGAILVNRPTLDGVYLLLGQAVVISCATGIRAFVFSGVGRQQGERRGICVARIEGSRPQ